MADSGEPAPDRGAERAGVADGGAGAKQPAPANDNSTLVTIAGAVASGLGLIGFVTFAGGVILWSRFNEMGLPADHALGLVTKSELVATGADFLFPALLISGAVVIVVVLVGSVVDFVATRKPQKEPAGAAPAEKAATEPKRPTDSLLRWLITPVAVGLVELAFAMLLWDRLTAMALIVLVGVIAIGALAISSGARINLAIFAVAIFVAVGSFAVARTYELTSHDLKVLPMAYSRTQPGKATRVEVGFFVAETSDRIRSRACRGRTRRRTSCASSLAARPTTSRSANSSVRGRPNAMRLALHTTSANGSLT